MRKETTLHSANMFRQRFPRYNLACGKKTICALFALLFALTISLFAGCNAAENQGAENLLYEKGVLTATGFESKYLGLRFELPDGFVMASEDEILSMMNICGEVMSMEKKAVDYAKLTTVYEMMAAAPGGSPNVIVVVEKLQSESATLEGYLNTAETHLSSLDYEVGSTAPVEFLGRTYQQVIASSETNGKKLTQKYMLRQIGDRVAGFITSSIPETEDELDILMQAFKEY